MFSDEPNNNRDNPNSGSVPHDLYDLAKEANLESEDSYRYEIDTNVHLEKLYYYWIGYVNMGGEWVRDPHRKPIMTQPLADILINEISMRINTHSFLSILTNEEIRRIAINYAIDINNTLMFECADYKMTVSNFKRLPNSIKDMIFILLKLAQNGHTVHYRMNKGKINVIRQEVEKGGVM